MTAWTPNIPATANAPSADQPLITNNFTAIQQDLDANHVTITDTVNRGKHKFVEMPIQSGAQTTTGGEGELHTQDEGDGTSQLYYSRDNLSGTLVQLTTNLIPDISFSNTAGMSFLPGGIIIQFGDFSFTGTASYTYSSGSPYNQAFPNKTVVVIAGPSNGAAASAGWNISNWDSTGFTVVHGSGSTTKITWIAIGY